MLKFQALPLWGWIILGLFVYSNLGWLFGDLNIFAHRFSVGRIIFWPLSYAGLLFHQLVYSNWNWESEEVSFFSDISRKEEASYLWFMVYCWPLKLTYLILVWALYGGCILVPGYCIKALCTFSRRLVLNLLRETST